MVLEYEPSMDETEVTILGDEEPEPEPEPVPDYTIPIIAGVLGLIAVGAVFVFARKKK